LKQLPSDLKYAFLDSESQFSVIIASDLSPQQDKLSALLRNYKFAIGWSLDDIHGISLPFVPIVSILKTQSKHQKNHRDDLIPF